MFTSLWDWVLTAPRSLAFCRNPLSAIFLQFMQKCHDVLRYYRLLSHFDKLIRPTKLEHNLHRCSTCGWVYMGTLTVSYAQALRVIGQNLVPLGINAFELATWGNDYIVWIKHRESARHPSANTVLDKITQKILGHADSDETDSESYVL